MNVIDFRATYATPLPADGTIPFDLTAKERDDAAFAQAQLRFDARRSDFSLFENRGHGTRNGKPASGGVTAAGSDGEGDAP
jgi:hypothetical protein